MTLLKDLCQLHAAVRFQGSQAGHLPPAFQSVEEAYRKIPPRFSGFSATELYYEWYMLAITRIVVGCWKQSFWEIRHDTRNGKLTTSGIECWNDLAIWASIDDEKFGRGRPASSTIPPAQHGTQSSGPTSEKRPKDEEDEVDHMCRKNLKGEILVEATGPANTTAPYPESKQAKEGEQKRS